MSKHTPGPWFHKTDFGQVGSVELADGSVVAQAQPLLPLDHAQRNANARLIAAAPELLKSLIEILPMAKDSLSHPNLSVEILDAIAAITKATGEAA